MIKRRTIKLVSSVYDPLIDIQIGNQTIKSPLSHPLREILKAWPHINYNVARIAKYLSSKYKDVKVIDIGANIGDTVAFIKNYIDAPVLSIDGDAKYIDILKKNIAQYSNVSVCHTLVGAETKEINAGLKKERGTAYIVESAEMNSMRTIEDILHEYTSFADAQLLKIDTDGFDTIILKGSEGYLKKQTPVLFFEFDPYLANKNNDDPFTLINYLKQCGYRHLIFYMSNGDYLLSSSIDQNDLINELVHYFSGRNIELYTDICAFAEKDKAVFELAVKEELSYFKKARNY